MKSQNKLLKKTNLRLFGGGVSNAGDKILKPIRKRIKDYSFARFGKKQTEVQIAKLGNDAGIIGAALLWKNE